VIYRASSSKVEGRTMKEALAIPDMPLQVNHDNVEAVRLLSQDCSRGGYSAAESAEGESRNVFTLNNMGVAKEMEGESEAALKYYDSAAAVQSDAAAVVTMNRSGRDGPQVWHFAAIYLTAFLPQERFIVTQRLHPTGQQPRNHSI